MATINIIVATSKNLVIGKNNSLPWNLPSDLKRFKKITEGHRVVMGRKCWDSLPEKSKPLPKRINIVVSRNLKLRTISTDLNTLKLNNVILIEDFKNYLEVNYNNEIDENIFIIGGSEIYKQSFKFAKKLYLTVVNSEIDGDTFLEGFNEDEWEEKYCSENINENGFEYCFKEFIRKKM